MIVSPLSAVVPTPGKINVVGTAAGWLIWIQHQKCVLGTADRIQQLSTFAQWVQLLRNRDASGITTVSSLRKLQRQAQTAVDSTDVEWRTCMHRVQIQERVRTCALETATTPPRYTYAIQAHQDRQAA